MVAEDTGEEEQGGQDKHLFKEEYKTPVWKASPLPSLLRRVLQCSLT